MQLLTEYFNLQLAVFKYFGYTEDWVAIPLDDAREYVWELCQREYGEGHVQFAESIEALQDKECGNYYENTIYTQRFLSQWVYRGKNFTMICVDTHTDGNKFLQVFDNSKELSNQGPISVNAAEPITEAKPFIDPDLLACIAAKDAVEKPIIEALGESMGYGRIMQLAQECWRDMLNEQGWNPGGEFAFGPCVAMTTKCGCDGGSCDWCGGSGWLTLHVKKMQDEYHDRNRKAK